MNFEIKLILSGYPMAINPMTYHLPSHLS